MIHEEICTYEVSKLAKEKGFPQKIDFGGYWYATKYYKNSGVGEFFEKDKVQAEDYQDVCNALYLMEVGKAIAAPTQALLQRWLRKKKNIHIEIVATACGYVWIADKTNGTAITDSDILDRGTNEGGCFDTYELALEDALKYALENLV